MPSDMAELRRYLQSFDIQSLMIDGLGWDTADDISLQVSTQLQKYTLKQVAQKAGFVIYTCDAPDGLIPSYKERQKIEQQVSCSTFEHMIVFIDDTKATQMWQWVKRDGRRVLYRHLRYYKGQTGDLLLQRLREIAFDLFDEPDILTVRKIVTGTMNVENVTKKFYLRFKEELGIFQKFIKEISNLDDKEWYASLMLNRMMFVYFFQKKGFLDNDTNYLRNRLERVKAQAGPGKFQQFYRLFLLRLFHEGLGRPERDRAPELAELLGQVPYLNGGIFDVHKLEQNNPKISIPDEAFEKIFDFFDEYQWHLDWRPHKADNEINPDVLGYIFEKYVNQKQMGAYYTKEDITGYIARNTIIPYLFDVATKECPEEFTPNGNVWWLLQINPDDYIYSSQSHGTTLEWNPEETRDIDVAAELSHPKPDENYESQELPESIRVGINDIGKREKWNELAPSKYALPKETWREAVSRREHRNKIRSKLKEGEVYEINELVTLNLNIEKFAKDSILHNQNPALIHAFWNAITNISILDPTCGSGAFLFAALEILEPLYTTCLKKMQEFLDTRTDHKSLEFFQRILDQVKRHPNRRYYVLKSIVINNLYGVDIIEEAVEICKLRLFLKLVAQLEEYKDIEPLPDIDFNVRAGNTLVGYVTQKAVLDAVKYASGKSTGQTKFKTEDEEKIVQQITKSAKDAERAFAKFKRKQTESYITPADKVDLSHRLGALRDKLDYYLAIEYDIKASKRTKYEKWKSSYKPFHWFVEFYGIMKKGGFDVIIGNPPYVEYRKVKKEYTVKNYTTESCGNLYAFVIERNGQLCQATGRSGMIIPHSSICTDRMAEVQRLLLNEKTTWISTYDMSPSRLFEVDQRLCIYLTQASEQSSGIFSSKYHRWYDENRSSLFQTIQYIDAEPVLFSSTIPKIHHTLEIELLKKISALTPLQEYLRKDGVTIYYHNAPRYWCRFTNFIPYFWSELKGKTISGHVKDLSLATKKDASATIAALNSTLFYWWFILLSDCRDLNRREIKTFPIGLDQMSERIKEQSKIFVKKLMNNLKLHSKRTIAYRATTGKVVYDEFDQKHSKPNVDDIDQILAKHYGFTDEELDFIINFDIKYRMGTGLG